MSAANDQKDGEPLDVVLRPTGIDAAEYIGHQSWSPRRWAWEFLRRNPGFINDCDEVDLSLVDSCAEIALAYGLKSFKHYSEEYYSRRKDGGLKRPTFAEAAISVKSNMGAKLIGSRKVHLRLSYGQVAIVFDLLRTLSNKRSIAKMTQVAKSALEKRQGKILKRSAGNTLVSFKPKRSKFLTYLRLVDLFAHGFDDETALRLANNEFDKSLKDLRTEKEQQLSEALECSRFRYRQIAVMVEVRPKKKSGATTPISLPT
ncbi:MAG TPA: hypothetical protein VE934_16315 [Polaromonas sp.]|uniref:hypothetical protein n=1 Tax=Polaromonas sp. TaxID=1869339 RepID=UPI002D5D5655|nr:hypothetical protein [Polaromonas sp.]HYW58519.1 hypothetical protein [Polaromonas sp.]